MKRKLGLFGTGFIGLVFAGAAIAANPTCYSDGDDLDYNNAQVVTWKSTTKNEFLARAHVKGTVSKLYSAHDGHTHFQARLGSGAADTLEVIYNDDFGTPPKVTVGQAIEACGDYITSIKATQYPVSPDHGIIHWLHENPRHRGHDDGFMVLDGEVYGSDDD